MFWFGLVLFILLVLETILHVAITKETGSRLFGLFVHIALASYIGLTLWGGK